MARREAEHQDDRFDQRKHRGAPGGGAPDGRQRSDQDTGGNDVGEPSVGQIKTLVADKGFGFIREEGTGADIFFHRSETDGLFDTLKEGQRVTFQPQTSPKGPRAARVKAVS